jgi:hypothetical protein
MRAEIMNGASLASSVESFERAPDKAGTRIAIGMNSIV